MLGLSLVVGSGPPERLTEAMMLLLAQRALGGPASLFCTGNAVAALASLDDASRALLDELLDQGVHVVVCQTSLSAHRVDADILDPRVVAGGMVSLLQGLGNDRLIAF